MDDSASRRVTVTDEQGDTNTNNGVKSLVMRRRARQGRVGNTLTNCNNRRRPTPLHGTAAPLHAFPIYRESVANSARMLFT